MDALLTIPREATPAVVFLRSEIPADHPSSAILGQERLGAGSAVAGDRLLTAPDLEVGGPPGEVTPRLEHGLTRGPHTRAPHPARAPGAPGSASFPRPSTAASSSRGWWTEVRPTGPA